MTTRFLVCGSVMMLAVACGGSDEAGVEGAPVAEAAGQAGPSAPAPESPAPAAPAPSSPAAEAPTPAVFAGVTQISPAKGAIGVMPDAKVEITFAQPMDRASTEAAFSLGAMLVKNGTFAWDAGDTKMTFTPNSALDFGLDMNVTIAPSATDKEGHHLGAAFESSFRTIRRVTTALAQKGLVQCAAGGFSIYIKSFQVGDDAANKELGALVGFDLAELPADLTSIESADFTLGMTNAISAVKVTAASITPGDTLDCVKDWAKPTRTVPNPLLPGKVIPLASEVKDMGGAVHAATMGPYLALDWANLPAMNKKVVYRVQASGFTANGAAEGIQYGGSTFAGSQPKLVVTYLQP